jgi:hypothetical protein
MTSLPYRYNSGQEGSELHFIDPFIKIILQFACLV